MDPKSFEELARLLEGRLQPAALLPPKIPPTLSRDAIAAMMAVCPADDFPERYGLEFEWATEALSRLDSLIRKKSPRWRCCLCRPPTTRLVREEGQGFGRLGFPSMWDAPASARSPISRGGAPAGQCLPVCELSGSGRPSPAARTTGDAAAGPAAAAEWVAPPGGRMTGLRIGGRTESSFSLRDRPGRRSSNPCTPPALPPIAPGSPAVWCDRPEGRWRQIGRQTFLSAPHY
jgi:hypothetical protein